MKFFRIIILFFPFCVFGQSDDLKTLSQSNFSIQYPAAWELDQGGQMETTFILFSTLESVEDKFRENVNLIIQDLTGYNLGLDEYTVISTDQIKTMIPNSSILENKRMFANNTDFQKVVYTGESGTYKLKFEQYYFVMDNKAYVLTLTCEQNKFDQYKNIGENILNSFTIKK